MDWSRWKRPVKPVLSAPDSYHVKGTSTYVDEAGRIKGQWIKTDVDKQRQYELQLEAIQSAIQSAQVRKRVKKPTIENADLAEIYTSDSDIEPGTVVSFGGDAEVTVSTVDGDRKIAGVISSNPGYLMNSEETGVAVALQGRVPCKVTGPISKGDMLVSAGNGMARAEDNPKIGQVIGKSLQAHDGGDGIIEVVVGRI